MPRGTARGSAPSRLPRRLRGADRGELPSCWARRLPGGESAVGPREPGLKGSGSCADGPPRPFGAPRPPRAGHAPSPRRPRPLCSGAPLRRASAAGPSAPRGTAWDSAEGLAHETPRPLRSCCRACYLRFSNQLELSMPSVSSWEAGERAPSCARALLCCLVRARASRLWLPAVRHPLSGLALSGGVATAWGALLAPGCARRFWNVPASDCTSPPLRWVLKAGGRCPGRPATQAHCPLPIVLARPQARLPGAPSLARRARSADWAAARVPVGPLSSPAP